MTYGIWDEIKKVWLCYEMPESQMEIAVDFARQLNEAFNEGLKYKFERYVVIAREVEDNG